MTGRVAIGNLLRFNEKWVQRGECLVWVAAKDLKGYGRFYYNGRMWLAHRWIYVWFGYKIPEGYDLCHHCDNPSCVNLEHLFPGTRKENMEDCVAKGRQKKGSRPRPHR